MKTSGFSSTIKKIFALTLIGLFSVLSPAVALAAVTQPVSAPITVPVPVPPPSPTPVPSPQPTAQPDLTIDLKSLIEQSATASAYAKITLTATVRNTGSSSAQPSVTQINTANSTEYWRLGTNQLNPGASQVLTVVTYKTQGEYQFTAQADADSQINESNENNNSKTITVRVALNQPAISAIYPSAALPYRNVVVTGYKFGIQKGYILFYNQSGQAYVNSTILGWHDDWIKFQVPALPKGNYQVAVLTAYGSKSNPVNFTIK